MQIHQRGNSGSSWLFNADVIPFTENNFTQDEMALMFGVSKRTVERRMAESQLTNMSRYTDIDDDMLDSFVYRIITNFPRSGK